MNRNIKDYCTPKRPRSESSPEYSCLQNSSTMNKDEFKDLLEIVLEQKLEKVASKVDIKEISQEIQLLREENKQLRDEVIGLKEEVLELKNEVQLLQIKEDNVEKKLEDLENRSRRNNLIFRGLEHDGRGPYEQIIKGLCSNILGVQIEPRINRAHPLGLPKPNCPIIAHIPWDEDISAILKNTGKLRGTKIYIDKDYTASIRIKRAKLRIIEKEIRKQNRTVKLKMTFDALIVNNIKFYWIDGIGLKVGNEDGIQKLIRDWNVDLTATVEILRRKNDADLNGKRVTFENTSLKGN